MIKAVLVSHFKDEVSCTVILNCLACAQSLMTKVRVGGRLDHASTLCYIEKHPIVMSKIVQFLNSLSHITMKNVCIRAEVLL